MAGRLRPDANGFYQFPGSLTSASPLQGPWSADVNGPMPTILDGLKRMRPSVAMPQLQMASMAQPHVQQSAPQLNPVQQLIADAKAQRLQNPNEQRTYAAAQAAGLPFSVQVTQAQLDHALGQMGLPGTGPQPATDWGQYDVPAQYLPLSMVEARTPDQTSRGNYLYGLTQSAPLADREFAARERMVADRAPWQPYDDVESRARARVYGGGPELLSEAVRRQRQEELAARIVSDFGGQGAQSPQDMLAQLLQDPSVQMNGANPELTYSGGRLQDTPWYDEYVALSNLNRALPQDQQIDLPAIHNTGTFVPDPAMLQRQQEVSDRRDAARAARRENVVLAAQAKRWGIHPAILSQLQQEQQQQELVNGLMERLLGGQGGQPGQPGAPGLGSGGGGIGDLIAAQALGIDPSAMVARQQLQWDQSQAGDAAQQRVQAMQVFQNPNASAAERLAAASMLGIDTDAALAGIQQPFSPEQIAAQRDELVPTIESALPQGTPSATDFTGVGPRVAYIQRINPGMSYEQALAQFYILYPNAPRQSGDPFDTSPQRQEPGSHNPYGLPLFMFGM